MWRFCVAHDEPPVRWAIRLFGRGMSWLLVLATAGLTVSSGASAAEPRKKLTGRVSKVIEGDQFVLVVGSKRHTVVLDVVDAPDRGQPSFEPSRKALEDEILGRRVEVTVVGNDKTRSSIIGRVKLDDHWVNVEMISNGWAWYRKGKTKSSKLAKLQNTARSQRRGFWAKGTPTPPWTFRATKAAEAEAQADERAAIAEQRRADRRAASQELRKKRAEGADGKEEEEDDDS